MNWRKAAAALGLMLSAVIFAACGRLSPAEEAELAAESHLQAGLKKFAAKDYAGAQTEFETALKLQPAYAAAANALSWVNQLLARADEGAGEKKGEDETEEEKRGTSADSGFSDSSTLVAPDLITEQEPEEFWKAYAAGIEAYFNGDYETLLAAAEEALNWLSPESQFYEQVLKARLFALIENGYYEQGVQAISEMLAELSADADILTLATLTYERAGYIEDAVWAAEQAYLFDPGLPAAQNNLAYTYAQAGMNLETAYELATSALAHKPDNPAYLDTMGWVLYQMGRPAEAERYLHQALLMVQSEAARGEILRHYEAVRSEMN